jgi:DNA-binding transcriptional MerR regulator
MNGSDLSVSEVARVVADPLLGDDAQFVQRQLQYWTERGILKTIGGTLVGRGGYRRYSADESYLAALLVRLGALGLPVNVLAMLTEGLEKKLSADTAARILWNEAVAGTKNVRLGFWFIGSAAVVHQLEFIITDAAIPDQTLTVPAIWIDVTYRFNRVRGALQSASN